MRTWRLRRCCCGAPAWPPAARPASPAGAAAEGEQLGEEDLPVGAEELALGRLRGRGSGAGWRRTARYSESAVGAPSQRGGLFGWVLSEEQAGPPDSEARARRAPRWHSRIDSPRFSNR